MQTVLSGRAVMATSILTTFLETSPAATSGLENGIGADAIRSDFGAKYRNQDVGETIA